MVQSPEEIERVKEECLQHWGILRPDEQTELFATLLEDVLDGKQIDVVREFLFGNSELPLPFSTFTLKVESVEQSKSAMLPVSQVAKLTGYSSVRLRDLLNRGKMSGEKRRSSELYWYTSVEEVRKYQANLPTSQEQGRKGALKRWHGTSS